MEKKIQIKISEDGKIYADTIGFKGKECLPILSLLEELLEAETIDSNFKEEYYDTMIETKQNNKLSIKEE